MKQYVKIDRKVLFEILDAILEHWGYSDPDECAENDTPFFCGKWDNKLLKKVKNIRSNS